MFFFNFHFEIATSLEYAKGINFPADIFGPLLPSYRNCSFQRLKKKIKQGKLPRLSKERSLVDNRRFGSLSIEWFDFEDCSDLPMAAEGIKDACVKDLDGKSGADAASFDSPAGQVANDTSGTSLFQNTSGVFIPIRKGTTQLNAGVLHLYRDKAEAQRLLEASEGSPLDSDADTKLTGTEVQEAKGSGRILSVLSVPSYMTAQDFLNFVGPFQRSISNIRIVRDSIPNRYICLLKFRDNKSADSFYRQYSAKRFNALDSEVCHVVYVKTILFRSEVIPAFPNLEHELSTDPKSVDGNFSGGQDDSKQDQRIDLKLSGADLAAHAAAHYEETSHPFALEIETQRVWDYAGDGYVHRLIQNKADGKLVELPPPSMDSDNAVLATYDGHLNKGEKMDSLGLEYTYLLTSQLESQRLWYESKISELQISMVHELSEASAEGNVDIKRLEEQSMAFKKERDDLRRQVVAATKERRVLEKRVDKLSESFELLQARLMEEREMNEALRRNQDTWKAELKAKDQLLEEKDRTVEELKEQVRDLMFYLETQQKVEQSALKDELQEGTVVIESASPPTKAEMFRTGQLANIPCPLLIKGTNDTSTCPYGKTCWFSHRFVHKPKEVDIPKSISIPTKRSTPPSAPSQPKPAKIRNTAASSNISSNGYSLEQGKSLYSASQQAYAKLNLSTTKSSTSKAPLPSISKGLDVIRTAGRPVVPADLHAKVPRDKRQKALDHFFNEFTRIFKPFLSTHPSLAFDHAIRQEKALLSKATPLTYMTMANPVLNRLKKRPVATSAEDVGIDGEWTAPVLEVAKPAGKREQGIPFTVLPDSVPEFKEIVACDCEMCYTSGGMELARITVIGIDGAVLLDELVKTMFPIVDLNTEWSGIKSLEEAKHDLNSVKKLLCKFMSSKTIIIGHGLENDLNAMRISHEFIVDTSVMFPVRAAAAQGARAKHSLKHLTEKLLEKRIQTSGVEGHDPKEDAEAALDLVKFFVKKKGKVPPY
ncbi:hypothetical protein HDU97_005532 [Phlyctochytrium planicorne]|nr:hypothetical protein HDU97_005532 [Phlyctochytrium planicorne]